MKTAPMSHQIEGRRRLAASPQYFALGAEQGTGKTWMLLDDAERQFAAGRITGVLVIAPNGVHDNWVEKEIPEHLEVPHRVRAWRSGAGKRATEYMRRVLATPEGELAILSMSIDGLMVKAGRALAEEFVRRFRVMMIVDESHMIKNPTAKRSRATVLVGEQAVSRRISSGTLVADTPTDLFQQYEFLRSGLLDTTSFRTFVATYAQLLPRDSSAVQEALRKSHGRGDPQIVAKDATGRPIYRNLLRLKALIAPHTYRVLKSECLDLPPKIYQVRHFQLEPKQQTAYDRLATARQFELRDGSVEVFKRLAILTKLQQCTSGYVIVDGAPQPILDRDGPRIRALLATLADYPGPAIIWARYTQEVTHIIEALESAGKKVVEYYGATPRGDRMENVRAFQSGAADYFVANAQAAGRGLTLNRAETVVYYSNNFSLELRTQSEDRAHRIGTKYPVVYIDLIARGTIDHAIANALQRKKEVADYIMDGL